MAWTEEKNQRRCDLIDLYLSSGLSEDEHLEFEELQKEMREYREKHAPLPKFPEELRILLQKDSNND